ncbi:MAG: UPF0182 family protein, partial [Chloroflexi bacterium]|nr:UPF0182 family protein [Chloroflexota bacterium]
VGLVRVAAELYTDWLWFEHLGHGSILATRLATQALLFGLVGGASLGLFQLNVAIARRVAARQERAATNDDEALWVFLARLNARLDDVPRAQWPHAAVAATGLAFAAAFGFWGAAQWETALRLLHAVPFQTLEPLFGRDAGFYVVTMPALRALVGWLALLLLATGAGVVATYLIATIYALRLSFGDTARAFDRRAWLHLAALGAGLLLMVAGGHQLARADLVFATSARAADVPLSGYADAVVQAPAYSVMTVAALVAASSLVLAGWRRQGAPALWAMAAYLVVTAIAMLSPRLVQAFLVNPNGPDFERPYIERLIAATRHSYGLAQVGERIMPAADEPPRIDMQTLTQLPLWDHLALRDALNQLQAFRPYYGFLDVDLDRYEGPNGGRAVTVAARELRPDAVPSRTWVATHLQYTHGYGLTMAAASGVLDDGSPRLLIRDLPPRGEAPVERPEIYYGEAPLPYAIVKASGSDLDPPRGDEDLARRYEGRGIGIGNWPTKLAFAVRFADPNLLLSSALGDGSELLYHRQIAQRVTRLAPFLKLDPDPYLVLADGRLYWIVDAYTTTPDYPLAYRRPFSAVEGRPTGPDREPINYIRNSVKAIVDAYEGSVRLFVADPTDPLLATYRRIYPDLLEPLEAMAPELRAHLRYPQQLFSIQADILGRFHVQDPTAFYYGDDVWQIAREKLEARVSTRPHYVLMPLPGEPHGELLLTQPFSPFSQTNDKHNLAGLLIARSDPPHAGELILQRYPRDRLVSGPFQVELRIDQDPSIAAQFGLWQRSGLLVMRSNLLTLPIGPTPLYVESVYLQRGLRPTIPELRRVILATGDRVVMESTVPAALARLTGQNLAETPASAGAPTESAVAQLTRAIRERLVTAQDALAAGDRGRYADELAGLEADLKRLEEL